MYVKWGGGGGDGGRRISRRCCCLQRTPATDKLSQTCFEHPHIAPRGIVVVAVATTTDCLCVARGGVVLKRNSASRMPWYHLPRRGRLNQAIARLS